MHRRFRDEFSIVRAATDIEACVVLRQLGSEVACVLTDLNLQGSTLSGVELIRLMRGTLPEKQTPTWARGVTMRASLPIIVLTGSDTHLNHAKLAGASKVMLKPVAFSVLQSELRRLVGLPTLPSQAVEGSAAATQFCALPVVPTKP